MLCIQGMIRVIRVIILGFGFRVILFMGAIVTVVFIARINNEH